MRRMLLIAAALFLGTCGYLLFRKNDSLPQVRIAASQVALSPPSETSAASSASLSQGGSSSGGDLASPPLQDFEKELASASDYAQFAREALTAAKTGDHVAQYQLSKALKYCEDGYRFYFDRGPRRRTIDEALAWASTRPSTNIDEVRLIYSRCEGLKDRDQRQAFGNADHWLNEASKGGVDLAKVDVARGLTLQAGNSGSKEDVARRNEAKQLLAEAVRSKDPRVIWEIGDLAALLVGDQEKATTEQWVWRLAACQRGYDCGPNAAWLKLQCRFDLNCQPYDSGEDYIRRQTSNDFDEINAKATELNRKLDKGQYEDLGI